MGPVTMDQVSLGALAVTLGPPSVSLAILALALTVTWAAWHLAKVFRSGKEDIATDVQQLLAVLGEVLTVQQSIRQSLGRVQTTSQVCASRLNQMEFRSKITFDSQWHSESCQSAYLRWQRGTSRSPPPPATQWQFLPEGMPLHPVDSAIARSELQPKHSGQPSADVQEQWESLMTQLWTDQENVNYMEAFPMSSRRHYSDREIAHLYQCKEFLMQMQDQFSRWCDRTGRVSAKAYKEWQGQQTREPGQSSDQSQSTIGSWQPEPPSDEVTLLPHDSLEQSQVNQAIALSAIEVGIEEPEATVPLPPVPPVAPTLVPSGSPPDTSSWINECRAILGAIPASSRIWRVPDKQVLQKWSH